MCQIELGNWDAVPAVESHRTFSGLEMSRLTTILLAVAFDDRRVRIVDLLLGPVGAIRSKGFSTALALAIPQATGKAGKVREV